VVASELRPIVDIDIAGAGLALRRREDDSNEIIGSKLSNGEGRAGLRRVAEGHVDETGAEPAVDVGLVTRPDSDGNPRLVASHLGEEALADSLPQIDIAADIADPDVALWQPDLVLRLAPELGEELRVALELEAR
jgi:hypothetical protein